MPGLGPRTCPGAVGARGTHPVLVIHALLCVHHPLENPRRVALIRRLIASLPRRDGPGTAIPSAFQTHIAELSDAKVPGSIGLQRQVGDDLGYPAAGPNHRVDQVAMSA